MSKKNKNMRYFPLPGSHRQRSRARKILKAQWISHTQLRVTGGEVPHVVTFHGKNDYSCDCSLFVNEHRICSHVIRVMMNAGTFPSPEDNYKSI